MTPLPASHLAAGAQQMVSTAPQLPTPSSAAVAAAAATAAARPPAAAEPIPKAASGQDLAAEGQQSRRKGTATNGKWAQYESSGVRVQRRRRDVHAGETLSAAVLSTGRLRLLLAVLLALLLAARWDAAAAAQASPSTAVKQQQRQARAASPPLPADGPWASLTVRLQGVLQQARQAVAGRTPPPAPAQPRWPLLAAAKDRVRGQMAAAAASPIGQQAGKAVKGVQRQAAAASASPAGQQAATAARAVQAWLAIPCQRVAAFASALPRPSTVLLRLYGSLAGMASSPAVRQALVAVDRLPPLAALLLLDLSLIGAAAAAMAAAPGLVHSTVSCSRGRRMPGPAARFCCVCCCGSCGSCGAADAANAMSCLLPATWQPCKAWPPHTPRRHPYPHRQLELDIATPGLVQRLAAWVPGLAQQLSLASAAQRLATGLLDDAAAFVAALVIHHQLPQLLGVEPTAAA